MGDVADVFRKAAPSYPSADDVAFARRHEATYGTRMDGHAKIDAELPIMSPYQAKDYFNSSVSPDVSKFREPMDLSTSDNLYAGWLASQRNPVAALGFDPSRTATSRPQNAEALNIVGAYSPSKDALWFDSNFPTALAHEATHRGLHALKNAGNKDVPAEQEPWVRGFMLRHYGDVENSYGPESAKQVEWGRQRLKDSPDDFSKMEDAAETELRRRDHKMGPR